MSKHWSLSAMPDLSGKVAIVTGGNTGLGFKTGLELARNGASVTIACRSSESGDAAAKKICNEVPRADINVLSLDLLNAESIRTFAEQFALKNHKLDLLVNNAGLVNLEQHQLAPNGQEMQMATNHLGHFALTGHLFSLLKSTSQSRVVIVSSLAYLQGIIDFTDLAWNRRKYNRMKCYGDSKLANLLFVKALNELFSLQSSSAIAVAAHPGLTATERQQKIGIGGAFTKFLASPVKKGCLPQLLAATEPAVQAGEFYGPKFGLLGRPVSQKLTAGARDCSVAKELWKVSEDITGIKYL